MKMSDSQFFAIQRIEGALETAKKTRIPVDRIRYLDDARTCIRIAFGELKLPWEDGEPRAHLNLVSQAVELFEKQEAEEKADG